LFVENLLSRQLVWEFISASKKLLKLLGAIHLRPVDGRIACKNAQPKRFGQLEVNRADLIEKVLASWRVHGYGRLRGIAPDVLEIFFGNIRAGDEAVEGLLIKRVAALNNNVADFMWELGIPNQADPQILVLPGVVRFSQADQVVFVKLGEQGIGDLDES